MAIANSRRLNYLPPRRALHNLSHLWAWRWHPGSCSAGLAAIATPPGSRRHWPGFSAARLPLQDRFHYRNSDSASYLFHYNCFRHSPPGRAFTGQLLPSRPLRYSWHTQFIRAFHSQYSHSAIRLSPRWPHSSCQLFAVAISHFVSLPLRLASLPEFPGFATAVVLRSGLPPIIYSRASRQFAHHSATLFISSAITGTWHGGRPSGASLTDRRRIHRHRASASGRRPGTGTVWAFPRSGPIAWAGASGHSSPGPGRGVHRLLFCRAPASGRPGAGAGRGQAGVRPPGPGPGLANFFFSGLLFCSGPGLRAPGQHRAPASSSFGHRITGSPGGSPPGIGTGFNRHRPATGPRAHRPAFWAGSGRLHLGFAHSALSGPSDR